MGSTTIYCDFRGEYSKIENEIRWIGREDEYVSVVVRKTIETITYCELIDEIWKSVEEDRGSKRHKGIINSVGDVYPMSIHGLCIFHLSRNVMLKVSNVNKEFVGKRFRECALTYSETAFKRRYEAFKNMYLGVGDYLANSVDEKRWAKCYFPGERYNIDTTNCVESINAVLLEARKYSFLPMLDLIVGKISEWYNIHRNDAMAVSNTQKLVPFVDLELNTRYKLAKSLHVQELNRFQREYSVTGRNGKVYTVNLTEKTYTCKHFDIDRYPYVHAIAAVIFRRDEDDPLPALCSKYDPLVPLCIIYSPE